jgi:hypothetical protein
MVGYLPITLAPAHVYNILNTVIRRFLTISASHGQEYTVNTVDQALYPRLGGLHISMNFLKVIGDHMD